MGGNYWEFSVFRIYESAFAAFLNTEYMYYKGFCAMIQRTERSLIGNAQSPLGLTLYISPFVKTIAAADRE
ncbi:hypothetical protein XELAEV_18036405mg [Xenopus laevis]|uniref:Uncharacterized protein n=1 Tax=Xenopus laevis TaxID=8355 RepID=A0A974HD13_XENLA|nr:hypothetical protein XELAEV_18036405mg [Xenopus laevis]